MEEQKEKKLKNKADKKQATKVILSTDEDTEEDIEEEDESGGIYLEKEDVLVIYKALKNYKPGSDDEEMVYELLVEQFEEILIVDYSESTPYDRNPC
jgi:hypothetical protein